MAMKRFAGQALIVGNACGVALATDVPLSFWGGVDPEDGRVIDKRHPLAGQTIAGRILVLPSGRGSCSASGVLLESIANGTAPAGIIVSEIDPIIGLGSILGDELLGRVVPVVRLSAAERAAITTGMMLSILPDGGVVIEEDSGDTTPESHSTRDAGPN
jgi:predicted aconitase with swiveling domain